MKRYIFSVALIMLISIYAASSSAVKQITMNPGKAFVNSALPLNEAFEKKTGIKVIVDKGEGGACGYTLKNLDTDKIDMGIMCCPVTKEEAVKKDLVQIPVARGGWVFVVNKSNPIDSLTTEQLRDIYQGRVTNWNEVGGTNAAMNPYAYIMCGPRDERVRQFLVGERNPKKGIVGIDNSKFGLDIKKVKPGNEENCSQAETDPNVIVVVPRADMMGNEPSCSAARNGTVKMISVDGIFPSDGNIANDTYPVAMNLFMITKGLPDSSEAQYINFIRSAEGRSIVSKAGIVVPLN
jgi:phosphate transport system substrate-binding protein